MGNVVVAPPNKAIVVSGCTGTKFYIGEAGWRFWFCNSVSTLDLELMQLNVASRQVETGEGVKLNVNAVTQVKVACFPKVGAERSGERILDKGNLKLACQHFLGEKNRVRPGKSDGHDGGPPAPSVRYSYGRKNI
jgi:uncharacterized membrane protein YqiK